MPSSVLLLAKNIVRGQGMYVPFQSKKGYRLCPFWPGIKFSFQGN